MKNTSFALDGENIFILPRKEKYNKKKIGIHHQNFQDDILKNRLLAPQDRVVHGSLSQWSLDLITAIQRIDVYSDTEKDHDKISDIYNNAALILFSIGDAKSARELCYSQIQMFITLGQRTGNHQLYHYVFMPWINLIRIDRLEGKFSDAMNKLDMMSATRKSKIKIAENDFATYLSSDKSDLDVGDDLLIKNMIAFELIKIFLDTHRYSDLTNYLERKIDHATYENQFIFHEAMIVSLANLGRLNEAREWLASTRLHFSLLGKNIFLYRECELRLKLGGVCLEEIQYLAAFSLCELQSKFININEILFAMQIAQLMCDSRMEDDAVRLLYFCLEAADKLGDETLKAECMILLHEQMRGGEGRVLIENLMIDHYVKTQYDFMRKRMQTSFHDLRHVESKQSHVVITSLFEELLSFSTIFMG